jgi:hypothetical protein
VSILRKSNRRTSSRHQIRVEGVQDGVLILPQKKYRLIIEATAINFELKSSDEQDAIIESYQSFLNALPCPLQITARIRELDMQRYLEEFRRGCRTEPDEIYRDQITAYTEFVQGLVTTNKILSRHFYIIMPISGEDHEVFEVIKEKLLLSADMVSKGLGRLGISTRLLTSVEVLDLFYSFYSPSASKLQPVTDQTLRLLNDALI